MSAPRFEAFLARLYVDRALRCRFLQDPRGVAAQAGLDETECQALEHIDRVGLVMAGRSFERKRKRGRRSGASKRGRGVLSFLKSVVGRTR